MVCLPCKKKAEARKQAVIDRLSKTNPVAAEWYKANVNVREKVVTLPRYEDKPTITNNNMRPKTIWNEQYRAFITNK